MLGAFVYAELAARRPAVGGQYAYLREAFHPVVGFSLRMGVAAGDSDRGYGGGNGDVCALPVELTGWQSPSALSWWLRLSRSRLSIAWG